MRTCIAISCLLLSALLTAGAADSPQPPAAKQETQEAKGQQARTNSTGDATGSAHIDPAKEADIRKLLQATGGIALMQQMMDGMEKNVKPMMANALPPGEYRERLIDLFIDKFHSKADVQQLLDRMIPIYDKYLTDEDIKGLIQFYGTPLGQKTLAILPQLGIESQGEGMKWGDNLGRQSMMEVLSEHPDLAKALEAAQKTATTR